MENKAPSVESTERPYRSERFPYAIEVILRELPSGVGEYEAGQPIVGQVDNLSQQGMCVSSPVPLMLAKVLRCQVAVKDMPVSVPTVAQVRWVQKVNSRNYRTGLRYLL